MKAGIIGLAQTGKTTIFNILTHGMAGTHTGVRRLEPNVGVVKVPDPRVDALAGIYNPEKTTYATIEFVDIQGLIRGKGQDLVWAPVRTVDVLVHVIRLFEDPAVPFSEDSIDADRDRRNMDFELILSDIASIEKRLERLDKDLKKAKNPAGEKEREFLERAKALAESGKPIREMEISEDERRMIKGFSFLSEKPIIHVLNIGEGQLDKLRQPPPAGGPAVNTETTMVCGKLEAEMSELPPEELQSFLADYSLTESGSERLIRTTYHLLGLISFLTAGEEECRAWTIKRGMNAQRAAGAIHTDLETHFIRAEVIHFDDFMACGGMAKAREKGLLRLEGKEYIVRDGDILNIRHSG